MQKVKNNSTKEHRLNVILMVLLLMLISTMGYNLYLQDIKKQQYRDLEQMYQYEVSKNLNQYCTPKQPKKLNNKKQNKQLYRTII